VSEGDTERERPSLELPKLRRRRSRPPVTDEPADQPVAPPVEQAAPQVRIESKPERTRRSPRLSRPGGMPAAVLTGALVGLGIVGLTWASLRGCEAIQGTSSCGDAGYGALFAILVVMVVAGALLLRLATVPEPGSTSFLGVGLTAVVALLFLVDSLMDDAMLVVIPLICAGSFAAAHWVTRTFVEPPRD
jgi:hypothetical protein